MFIFLSVTPQNVGQLFQTKKEPIIDIFTTEKHKLVGILTNTLHIAWAKDLTFVRKSDFIEQLKGQLAQNLITFLRLHHSQP